MRRYAHPMRIKKYHLIIAAKLLFIGTALWWVLRQLDLGEVDRLMRQSSPWALSAAVVSFFLAQSISGLRMRYYYEQCGLQLGRKFSVALYLVAALYNMLLPGGMGGDGYKVFLIGRLSHLSYGQSTRVTVSERASGLFILLLMALGLAFYTDALASIPYGNWLLLAAVLLLPVAYLLSVKILLKESPQTAAGALVYSFFIQGLNVVCILFLLHGLHVWEQGAVMTLRYVMLFLFAAIASVLPVTIGGVGLRELTFFYGAAFLGTDAETGVALALLFFLTNLMVAMTGGFFTHKLTAYYEENGGQIQEI